MLKGIQTHFVDLQMRFLLQSAEARHFQMLKCLSNFQKPTIKMAGDRKLQIGVL